MISDTQTSLIYQYLTTRHMQADNNPKFDLDRRKLFFDFREGAQEDSIPATKIGTVTIDMKVIERRCQRDEVVTFREEIMPGPSIEHGALEIEIRRIPVPGEKIQKEIDDIKVSLNVTISDIRRFNSNDNASDAPRMTANIRGRGNVSILHAAIVFRDENMIKDLIQLGANPQSRCRRFKTPMTYALMLK